MDGHETGGARSTRRVGRVAETGRERGGANEGGVFVLRGLRVLFVVLATAVFVPVVVVAAVGDPEGRRACRVARWWAWLNARACGIEIEVAAASRRSSFPKARAPPAGSCR